MNSGHRAVRRLPLPRDKLRLEGNADHLLLVLLPLPLNIFPALVLLVSDLAVQELRQRLLTALSTFRVELRLGIAFVLRQVRAWAQRAELRRSRILRQKRHGQSLVHVAA